MPERLMGTDCKSVSIAYAGSNPARPTFIKYSQTIKEFLQINSINLKKYC